MNNLPTNGNSTLPTTQGQTPMVFNFFDPQQFETMQRVCKMFANSELVPDMYKAKYNQIPNGANETQIAAIQAENKALENKAIANCMIAISISMRIGADPLMIMQNMVPIYGKPSWSSKFLISTVNTCGRFNPLRFKFTEKGMLGMVDYTDYVWNNQTRSKQAVNKQFDGKKIMDIECVAWTTAKGSNDVLESSPVTIRLAIQEGWYTKSGSKWQTMPKQMLMYRAAAWWTNVFAPELSMGMKTEDEVRDIVDAEYIDVTDVVENEKVENANKTNIGFDKDNSNDNTSTTVDKETGEIKNDAQTSSDKPVNTTAATPGF